MSNSIPRGEQNARYAGRSEHDRARDDRTVAMNGDSRITRVLFRTGATTAKVRPRGIAEREIFWNVHYKFDR